MNKRHLGTLEVSALGLGCIGLTANYGDPVATAYGENSRPDHIRTVVDQMLQRLRTDRIDLLYQHRVDPDVPIDDVAIPGSRKTTRVTENIKAADITLRRTVEIQPQQPTVKGPAETFTGDVWVDMIAQGEPASRLRVGIVRFAPSAHTAWHRHRNGQTLHILDGYGLVQSRGGQVLQVGPGDTIDTPPGEWHWHGAAPGRFMTHLAMSEDLADGQQGPATEWGDHLTADEYPGPTDPTVGPVNRPIHLDDRRRNMTDTDDLTPAQRAIGNFAPKLVSLTDDILFGDIWERAELSKRDRSLVTVAALIAGGNTEQLRNHLLLAKSNGLTEDQLKEVIIHLAFYAGWPRAMSAINVAKNAFGD